jgi:hypothetical protein
MAVRYHPVHFVGIVVSHLHFTSIRVSLLATSEIPYFSTDLLKLYILYSDLYMVLY